MSCNALSCARLVTHALATVQMFILTLLSVQTLYDGESVYTRRLGALSLSMSQSLSSFDLSKPFEFQSLKDFRDLKDFRALKAFRDSEVNSMSSLAHTWYIKTHPHMHEAEAGERVRVSSLYSFY